MYSTLLLEITGNLATITLNRPEKRNAISTQMMAELQTALDQIEKSHARVAIVTGSGKAFCAGMDLDMLAAIAKQSPAENQEDSRRIAKMFRRIWSYPRPLIAAVNGAAYAGGCGIATLCDFTLAVPEAKFGYTEVKIGFLPAIVSVFLTRQIGEKRSRDLLLTGRIIEAPEAKEFGLVSEVVQAEHLMERAHELADQLIAASPSSLARSKHLLVSSAAAGVDHDLERAILENARIRCTPDLSRKNKDMRMIEYHDAVVRVRYAETDQMGVVYHANYLVWFEVGRVELMRALGFEYKRMEIDDDCHIVVADLHCRYHHSAMYDEVLRIRTRIAESRNRLVKFSYEVIRDADGKVLANGETTHVICGSNGRPKLLPKKYETVFNSIVAPQPDRSTA